jgi:hypothetical protein
MRPQLASTAAALVFVALAAFAIVHRAVGGNYWGVTPAGNVVVDVMLAVVWLAAAAAAVLRRGFPLYFLAMSGAAVALIHGLMFSVVSRGTGAGVPFLVAAVAITLLLTRSRSAWDTDVTAHAEAPRPTRWRPLWPRHA